MILALVGETLFKDLIEQAAEAEEKDCLVLADEETLLAALQEETPRAIFMEVDILGQDASELIQKLRQNPATRRIPIVAFGNSLRADLLQDAKEAGADLGLPKSAFREQLPELFRHYDPHHP
ncbi:MAG TPA: hypothetical protein VMV05_08080 [bacterium]|nr:hypothetical protein [bacterium]